MRAYRPVTCERTEYRDGTLYSYCRGNLVLETHGEDSGRKKYSARCILCGREPFEFLDKYPGDLEAMGFSLGAVRRVARGANLFLWRVVEIAPLASPQMVVLDERKAA